MDERHAVSIILSKSPDACFLDLGSYTGNDSVFMAQWARGFAVEADPQNFESMKNSNLPVPIKHAAIADRTGICDFWVCESPGAGRGSGSIREPTGHLVRNGEPYTFKKTEIPCITLDDLFIETGFDHLDVIWADLQGGERDMIAGGQKTLELTRYMLIESEYAEELYKGQAMRQELLRLLPDWSIVEVFDFNLLMVNKKLHGA